MKKAILLSLMIISFSAFSKNYEGHGVESSKIPGIAGCMRAKAEAIEDAKYQCFQDGNQNCELLATQKIYSHIALVTIGFTSIQGGACSYKAIVSSSL